MVARQQLQVLRQTEFIHRPDVGVDNAKNEIGAEPMSRHARTESACAVGIREIRIAAFLEELALGVGKKRIGQGVGLFAREAISVRPDRLQGSVQTPDRRCIDSEMNIRSARLLADGEVIVDVTKQMGAHKKRQFCRFHEVP